MRKRTLIGLIIAAFGFVLSDLSLMFLAQLGVPLPSDPVVLTIAIQWFVVALIFGVVFFEGQGLSSLGFFKRWAAADVVMVLLAPVHMWIASILVGGLLQLVTGIVPEPNLELLGQLSAGGDVNRWLLLGVALTAGICEEILYRGYLLSRLDAWLGRRWRWLTVLLPSLIFGLLHAPTQGLIPALTLAIVWALPASLIFLKRRKLGPLILAHAFYDFMQFFVVLPFALRFLEQLP